MSTTGTTEVRTEHLEAGTAGAAATTPPGRVYGLAGRVGAVTISTGAVLAAVSTLFDPRSVEPEPRGMYVAYGADPAGADVAATILHYGFLGLGLGLLLTGFALASRRGRILTVLGGVLSGVGFTNISGAVVEDWFDAQMAAALGPDKAMELSERALSMPALSVAWMIPMMIGCTLGPILLTAGLARGRVLGWWTVALPTSCGVLFVAGHGLGPVGFLLTVAAYALFGLLVARATWRAPAPDGH